MGSTWQYDVGDGAWVLSFTYEFLYLHRSSKVIEVERVTDDELSAGDYDLVLMRLRRALPSAHVDALDAAVRQGATGTT